MDRTEVTKMQEHYVICIFTFFKSLVCLALQTETIAKKITQPKSPKTKNELTKICNEPGGIRHQKVLLKLTDL